MYQDYTFDDEWEIGRDGTGIYPVGHDYSVDPFNCSRVAENNFSTYKFRYWKPPQLELKEVDSELYEDKYQCRSYEYLYLVKLMEDDDGFCPFVLREPKLDSENVDMASFMFKNNEHSVCKSILWMCYCVYNYHKNGLELDENIKEMVALVDQIYVGRPGVDNIYHLYLTLRYIEDLDLFVPDNWSSIIFESTVIKEETADRHIDEERSKTVVKGLVHGLTMSDSILFDLNRDPLDDEVEIITQMTLDESKNYNGFYYGPYIHHIHAEMYPVPWTRDKSLFLVGRNHPSISYDNYLYLISKKTYNYTNNPSDGCNCNNCMIENRYLLMTNLGKKFIDDLGPVFGHHKKNFFNEFKTEFLGLVEGKLFSILNEYVMYLNWYVISLEHEEILNSLLPITYFYTGAEVFVGLSSKNDNNLLKEIDKSYVKFPTIIVSDMSGYSVEYLRYGGPKMIRLKYENDFFSIDMTTTLNVSRSVKDDVVDNLINSMDLYQIRRKLGYYISGKMLLSILKNLEDHKVVRHFSDRGITKWENINNTKKKWVLKNLPRIPRVRKRKKRK